MDRITYCDVNTCEECPRYGDDCDGDKRVEHTDYISRADAIEVVHKHFTDALDDLPTATDEDCDVIYKDTKSVNELLKHNKAISKALKALPSADAVQGGDAEMQTVAKTPDYMQQSRHDDGRIKVVRCKDCIRNNDGNLCDIAYFINADGDGFCNCGERREE